TRALRLPGASPLPRGEETAHGRVLPWAVCGRVGSGGAAVGARPPTRGVAVFAELAREGPQADLQGLGGHLAVAAEAIERRFDELALHLAESQTGVGVFFFGRPVHPRPQHLAGQLELGRDGT